MSEMNVHMGFMYGQLESNILSERVKGDNSPKYETVVPLD